MHFKLKGNTHMNAFNSCSATFSRYFLATVLVVTGAVNASAKVETSATYFGNVGAELRGFADDGTDTTSGGSFTLSNIPAGALILRATLHSMDVGTSNVQSAFFNGNLLGAGTEVDSDGIFPLRSNVWDVTALVSGNGDYPTRIMSADTTFGAALSVAFLSPTLPLSTVVINSGMSEVAPNPNEDIETTIFNDPLIGLGPSKLFMFTFADDTFATNEKIVFNGLAAGGPIDANLAVNPGEDNSLFELSVNTIAGANTLLVSSPSMGDQFGFPVAVLVSPMGVPEPATLVALATSGLLLVLRRPRRS